MLRIIIFTLLIVSLLYGCGVNNNVTVTTTPGVCPTNNNSNAPYCMSVKITNNGGGQNFVTSTSFPMSNISISITGVGNVQSPADNPSTMDPNGCTTNNLNPGSSCTYYLKISNESYAVTAKETATLTMTYKINDTLFGNSNSTYTSSFNFYQVTNLYITQATGYITTYNANSNSSNSATLYESQDLNLRTAAIDTNSFGYLYIGGQNLGIYQYGNGTISTALNTGSIQLGGGSGNLLTIGSNMYVASSNKTSTPIWIYSLANESWVSNPDTLNFQLVDNANAISTSGSLIYYANANSNQVFACKVGSTSTCAAESVTLGSKISTLAFTTPNSPYSGLYAGTESGLYVKTGLGESITWQQVQESSTNIAIPILTSTIANNDLFAGDSQGNIWYVKSSLNTPNKATRFLNGSNAPINGGSIIKMVVDINASMLYFVLKSISNIYALYSCPITTTTCNPTAVANAPIVNNVVGLNIGSQLVSSLN